VELIRSGSVIGLGTGSTVRPLLELLGERLRDGRLTSVVAVPTSEDTAARCRDLAIPLTTLEEHPKLALVIDGADEIGPGLNLIKGLGGALLREKVVASITRRQIIVIDPSKIVDRLGTRSPLPVEVLPFGAQVVKRKLAVKGLVADLRTKDGKPFVTDNGNLVLYIRFEHGIASPQSLERDLNNIPGVVENGLFLSMTWKVIVGEADGSTRELSRR